MKNFLPYAVGISTLLGIVGCSHGKFISHDTPNGLAVRGVVLYENRAYVPDTSDVLIPVWRVYVKANAPEESQLFAFSGGQDELAERDRKINPDNCVIVYDDRAGARRFLSPHQIVKCGEKGSTK